MALNCWGEFILIKKRGLQNSTGAPSAKKQQPSLYLGNKMVKGYSGHGDKYYSKPSSGCGCGGKVAKKTGIQAKK